MSQRHHSNWTIFPEHRWTNIGRTLTLQIFEPVFTTRQDRTGLGMAIARRIVHDHRGKVEVESEEMKGTRFTVTLPLAEEPAGSDLTEA